MNIQFFRDNSEEHQANTSALYNFQEVPLPISHRRHIIPYNRPVRDNRVYREEQGVLS